VTTAHRLQTDASRAERLPQLGAEHWPPDAYRRTELPEKILQFGTGMLLRALPTALVDAANRAGEFSGRIVVVQSTARGCASTLNAQSGLFTLVERGVERGELVVRSRLIGSVSRALVADREWSAVRSVAASPALRVIISNVTEAGFRLAPAEVNANGEGVVRPSDANAPAGFPAKLTDVLYHRFQRLPDGPPVFVIPTELVDDNGARLASMVQLLSTGLRHAEAFRGWLSQHVRFCSSLVDRITTGTPPPALRADLHRRLGYEDALLTVSEPYALWAIECDPSAFRVAFPIDVRGPSDAEPPVVIAADIEFYRERKIRLLNGTHSAVATLALLAGVPLVRQALEHAQLGPFLRRVLFSEIVPVVDLPRRDATAFAATVEDRLRNPWLDHEWRVIAGDQTAKMRLRVIPSIAAFVNATGVCPEGLALGFAAYVRYVRCVARSSPSEGTGWWRGESYPISDADLAAVTRHWEAVDPKLARAPIPTAALERVAASVLADAELWGRDLTELPGVTATISRWLVLLERDGVARALDVLGSLPTAQQA
jgi:tagaturonate reductase